MAAPNEPGREHPNTYIVQDRSSEEERFFCNLELSNSVGQKPD